MCDVWSRNGILHSDKAKRAAIPGRTLAYAPFVGSNELFWRKRTHIHPCSDATASLPRRRHNEVFERDIAARSRGRGRGKLPEISAQSQSDEAPRYPLLLETNVLPPYIMFQPSVYSLLRVSQQGKHIGSSWLPLLNP